KKCDGHKLHVKSSSIDFPRTVSEISNTGHSQRISPWEVVRARFHEKIRRSKTLCKVELRLVFRAPSRKFKILALPDVLAHGKSYEHSLMKKCKGHKLCVKSRAKSSFDRFFVHHFRNSKYCPFPTY
ncbi:hypothetical protein BHE74_00022677, partial [Ensete ventricosum]